MSHTIHIITDENWLEYATNYEQEIRQKAVKALCNSNDITIMRYLLRLTLDQIQKQSSQQHDKINLIKAAIEAVQQKKETPNER